MCIRDRFKSEIVSEGETDAVVRLTFVDNSPSVDVRMRKTDGYWLPVGLAGQPAGGFSATVNGEALPVGETVQQAVQTAAGALPLLHAGDQIELLFDPAPDGEGELADAGRHADNFAFRLGRSRETAFSREYDELYELLKHEREHGYVVWVMGPAFSFNGFSRTAFSKIIEAGYVDAVFAGNALATHDLEGSYFHTALGQDIETQENLSLIHI